MFKYFISLIPFFIVQLYAGIAIVPGDEQYYSHRDENVTFLYTKQNRYAAQQAMGLEPEINAAYEKLFGFRMDSRLFVGIISQQNQVSNGFSTQYPVNMQINYNGGGLSVDHATTTSWLISLLYHETTHNYQINAKASAVTRGLDSVFGTSYVLLWFFPLTSIPNVTISSFLLEGNAVLNESWQGNGGRLYSGRFKAETLLQAKAGNINAPFLYNQEIGTFPYYDRHYIVGGFFQLYLAEHYGLDKTNSFFYNHSKSWLWPFMINDTFEMTFGVDYEVALRGFEQWLLAEGRDFVEAEGTRVASSLRFSPLNANCDKIFFLTSNAYRAPELVTLFKDDKYLSKVSKSFLQGKLIKVDDAYYTQASGFNGPTKRLIGLYDEDAHLKPESESKVIQGYLRGGIAVYFDVASSFDQPQLYVGDEFYAQVNSSVFIDKDDNLYYFVQEHKKRTLYKNREALYTYNGYYGIVSDVDSLGNVYFIANSKRGSSLYRYTAHGVERLSPADNIIDARLLDDDEVLIAAVGQENYYYLTTKLEIIDEEPYEERLFFEEAQMAQVDANLVPVASMAPLSLEEAYYGPLRTEYAGTELAVGLNSKNNSVIATYNVKASFIDPLLTNRYALFLSRGYDEVGIVGASYDNNAHLLGFGASVYGVYDEGDSAAYHLYDPATNTYGSAVGIQKESRDYGLSAFMTLPVMKRGYDRADLDLRYYQDYDNNVRSPLVLSGSISHAERYYQAADYNYLNALSLFGSYDRSDLAYGVDYRLAHDLPHRFYLSAKIKGVRSEFDRQAHQLTHNNYTRGVKFSNFGSSLLRDRAMVVMPTLEHTRFVKQAAYGELALKKQFNATLLFFTFPFSLTREMLYAKHRYYDIEDFGQSSSWGEHTHYNESTLGMTLDILVMNRVTLPLNFEYIHNDNTFEEHNFRFSLGTFSF